MNGEPTDENDLEVLEWDPLGLIPPPTRSLSYCEECGGVGEHLAHCPLANEVRWTQERKKRDALAEAADKSTVTLVALAARRVAARLLRRIARRVDP